MGVVLPFLRSAIPLRRRTRAPRTDALATIRDAMRRKRNVIAWTRLGWVMFWPAVLGEARDGHWVLGWKVTGETKELDDPARWRWYRVADLAHVLVAVPRQQRVPALRPVRADLRIEREA